MKKAAFHNLGCKVNAYETEAMQEMLEKAGYEIVPFKEGADVLCDQHMYRHKYRGPEIPADAPPSEEDEPGGGRCGGRVLCPGTERKGYRSMH